jgi:hypothetical protein
MVEPAIVCMATRSAGHVNSRHSFVAEALVSSGGLATIALAECGRQVTGTEDRTGRPALAGVEQALAPSSAERQGAERSLTTLGVAGESPGCATGELHVSRGFG